MALLDWRPTVDLDEGLKATISWFESEESRAVAETLVAAE